MIISLCHFFFVQCDSVKSISWWHNFMLMLFLMKEWGNMKLEEVRGINYPRQIKERKTSEITFDYSHREFLLSQSIEICKSDSSKPDSTWEINHWVFQKVQEHLIQGHLSVLPVLKKYRKEGIPGLLQVHRLSVQTPSFTSFFAVDL